MAIGLIARIVILGLVLIGLEMAGFWIWFVAHPSWSAQGVYIGLVIGLGLMIVGWGLSKLMGTRRLMLFVLSVIVAIAAVAATKLGKMGFVNSYAENQLAGKFWYFGYMSMIGAVFAMLVALLRLRKSDFSK